MGDFDVIYDATGRKWMQKSTTESLIYVGGMLFRDGDFASLQLADGRIFQDDQAQDVFTEYHHKDHLGNVRVVFVDYDGDGVINLTDANSGEVSQVNTYYPFGLVHPENCGPDAVVGNENRWTYNNKELIDEVGLYDYGVRYYDPGIGRWGQIDPLSHVQEIINPYAYSLNNPIVYVDPDGSLPILINGLATKCEVPCRANKHYWGVGFLATIANSGIANPGGQLHFVDGDQYDSGHGYYPTISRGNVFFGNSPRKRRIAGIRQASRDYQEILSKLERDPETGKIIERIQIYAHSRGSAFAEGYASQLRMLIMQDSDLFADASSVIEFSLNLAPHQSSSIDAVDGVSTFSMHHNQDVLSGNKIGGALGAFSSDVGNGTIEAHLVESFTTEVGVFLDEYLKTGASQSTIDNFVKRMKDEHGIEVEVH